MAEANVEMVAYADLGDPVTGHVEAGDTFTTTEKQAKFYRKANWAGSPGTDPRDIQLEVAAEEYQNTKDARLQARDARQVFRNLGLASAQRGTSAAVDVMPQSFLIPQDERPRTNEQQVEIEGGDPGLVPQEQSGSAGGSTGGSGQSQGGDYNDMTVPELRDAHESRGLGKGSDKNKAELVEALESNDEGNRNK